MPKQKAPLDVVFSTENVPFPRVPSALQWAVPTVLTLPVELVQVLLISTVHRSGETVGGGEQPPLDEAPGDDELTTPLMGDGHVPPGR